ncbi:MAG: hypothetical protein KDC32_24700, partial [Saprospiraceae bacterium]|nr:hypothetical protein [Saprospiraceae bacterium]
MCTGTEAPEGEGKQPGLTLRYLSERLRCLPSIRPTPEPIRFIRMSISVNTDLDMTLEGFSFSGVKHGTCGVTNIGISLFQPVLLSGFLQK